MSLPRYPAYKDSGVSWLGEVPAHWEIAPIKRAVCSFEQGWSPQCENFAVESTSEWGVLKVGCVNGGVFRSAENKKLPDELSPLIQYSLKKGDLLISRANTRELVGSAAVVPRDFDNLLLCDKLYRARTNLGYAFVAYLALFLGTPEARSQIELAATGASSSMLNIGQAAILDLPIPRFEQGEMNAILAFLDRETAKIDALISEQEKLIALLAEKRQATISHAVTRGLDPNVPLKDSGVPWLGKVPAHWEVCKIKHQVLSIEQGWSPQCENFPVESSDEWGVLKVGCVNGGIFNAQENKKLPAELNPLPEYSLRKGDLLISRANTRELVGSAAVVHHDFPHLMLCDKLYRLRIRPSQVMPDFVSLYLGTKETRSQIELEATGASSSMLNVGQSVILDLLMPLPSLEEQSLITSFITAEVQRFNQLLAESTHAISLLKERRAALISAAVTGKIDVRGLAA